MNIRRNIVTFLLALFAVLPLVAAAQTPPPPNPAEYVPLAPFSGLFETTFDMRTDGLQRYLSGIFKVAIGLSGILAVVMLVICGIRVMGTGSASAKSEAKECITNAIVGLLLAIGSWVLLNTINPALTANDLRAPTSQDSLTIAAPDTVSAPPPTRPGTWYFQSKHKVSGEVLTHVYETQQQCANGHSIAQKEFKEGIYEREPITECIEIRTKPISSSEKSVRDDLKNSANIYVNKAPCPTLDTAFQVVTGGCTSVEGLSSSARDALVGLASAVGGNGSGCTETSAAQRSPACKVLVTGGTEAGHSKAGSSSHAKKDGGVGNVFDIAKTKEVIEFLQKNAEKVAPSFQAPKGSPTLRYLYRDFWYTLEPDHFHVCKNDGSVWYCRSDRGGPDANTKLHCEAPASGSGPKKCDPCDSTKSTDKYKCPQD